MQRVRIGLTGLGFVFLVVLLATALTGSPDAQTPAGINTIANAEVNKAAPQEPLAELGVTPGNVDANGARMIANQAHPSLH
jgi:hypothetical protein